MGGVCENILFFVFFSWREREEKSVFGKIYRGLGKGGKSRVHKRGGGGEGEKKFFVFFFFSNLQREREDVKGGGGE